MNKKREGERNKERPFCGQKKAKIFVCNIKKAELEYAGEE